MKTKDKLAIHELLGRAGYHYDERQLDELSDCFADDAHMLVAITDADDVGPFEGRDAVMQLMSDAMASQTDVRRHVNSNIIIKAEQDDRAVVLSTAVVFSVEYGAIKPVTSGTCRDEVVKTDQGWKISRRRLDLDLPF